MEYGHFRRSEMAGCLGEFDTVKEEVLGRSVEMDAI